MPCRVATTGLLALLCSVYPQYHIVFILLISLDIFSHWFQMYSTLLAGSSTHKVRYDSRRSSSSSLRPRGVEDSKQSVWLQRAGEMLCYAHLGRMAIFLQAWCVQSSGMLTVIAVLHLQDVHSRSWLVRLYYRNRIFMGFCCVCCEVEYLALYLLQIPSYQKQYLIPLQLPEPLQQLAVRTPMESAVTAWEGLPLVGLFALLALPGVVVKQLCNWVQLKAAVQSLVAHDVKKMS